MTLSELHPDELLWRDACGTLTPDERADLTAHLQRCPACALERVVRIEAARARVPSEADHALAARLVDRVLATSERRLVMATTVRGGWHRPLAVAAAAVVLVAGTAFAATALVVRARAQRATRALVSRGPITTPAERHHGPEASAPDPGGAPDTRPLPPPAVFPGPDRRSPRDNARARPRLPRSNVLAAESVPATPPLESTIAVGESPAQLLSRAEQARTARRWADASRAFADLGRRYPGSREEIVGRALYGQLLLDQLGEPRRALAMFERYLSVDASGALAEEALFGRATALMRMGRAADEKQTWLELLGRFPGSVYAARARERLRALK